MLGFILSIIIVVGSVASLCFLYAAGFYGCRAAVHGAFARHYGRLIDLGNPTYDEIHKSVVKMSDEITELKPKQTFLNIMHGDSLG